MSVDVIDGKNKQPINVIIKFKETIDIPYVDSLEKQFSALGLSGLAEIFDDYPEMAIQRLIVSVTPEEITELEESARKNRKEYNLREESIEDSESLLSYFRVIVPSFKNADAIIKRFRNDESIEKAYFEVIFTDAHLDLNPQFKDPFIHLQKYLNAAPEGIDAFAAWKEDGGCGAGVILADIEKGWKTNHEDLQGLKITSLGRGVKPDSHGTMTLGVVVGTGHNGKGIIGIAHEAQEVILSHVSHSQADGITNATIELQKRKRQGDVILIEQQGGIDHDNLHWLCPVEISPDCFKAIRNATDNLYVVIEAAGNGLEQYDFDSSTKEIKNRKGYKIGTDLDAARDPDSKERVLNRNVKGEFRESGAIIVGAAHSSLPHEIMSFSSYGSRVDCFAWGENVVTTSMNSKNNDDYAWNTDKREGFSGTSSASAIIAGAAMCIQGIFKYKNKNTGTLTSIQMRDVLASTDGIPSLKLKNIGVMPNLKKIIPHLSLIPGHKIL